MRGLPSDRRAQIRVTLAAFLRPTSPNTASTVPNASSTPAGSVTKISSRSNVIRSINSRPGHRLGATRLPPPRLCPDPPRARACRRDRPNVLHPGNPGLGAAPGNPISVRQLPALALAVETRKVLGRRRLDTALPSQLLQPQELPQRKGTRAAPFQPVLRVDAFDVAHKVYPEIAPRRYRRCSQPGSVTGLAGRLGKATLYQDRLQTVVKHMTRPTAPSPPSPPSTPPDDPAAVPSP